MTAAAGAEPNLLGERWPAVLHTELPAVGPSLIDRALCFRHYLAHWIRNRQFDAIQFRSIFEGFPLVELVSRSRLIFEVNGLPSIELKYRYPGAEDDRELMRKVMIQEQACLHAADLIVTPSGVTRDYLTSARFVSLEKVRVIPNGVDVDVFRPAEFRQPNNRATLQLLYFGTLSAWQGVELGIRALAQVRAHVPAELTIVGAASGWERDGLLSLAAKLGLTSFVRVLSAMPQSELVEHLHASDILLAPLTLDDRNVVQGCCPLKILEAMAAGVPVIASDLPVVRELGCDGEHFLLVKAGSVAQIAQAALRLTSDRELAAGLAERARAHVVRNFTWKRAGDALAEAYEELGISRSSTVLSCRRS